MYKEYRESYCHKFNSPFAAYLHEVSLDGTYDIYGDAEFGEPVVIVMSKHHVLVEDVYGFVDHFKCKDSDEFIKENFPSYIEEIIDASV